MTDAQSTMNLESRQQELIDTFEMFGDWMEKYEHLIELGKELKPMAEADRVDENLIQGCQSRVWIACKTHDNGHLTFTADSDAIITKGLVALVLELFSNAPAAEIATANLHCLQKIGLHDHLSPNRSNGLSSMVQKIKLTAVKSLA
jgi:cysteine desulfuration protein SufE